MNCREAIKTVMRALTKSDICLFTTGFISREAFGIKDRPENFYMLGSMGLVSSVGLGIALNTDRRVVIFDGDGSTLMDMGTMAMIANEKTPNLVHIVLDNEAYGSTGNQPTISKGIDISKVAQAMGYRNVVTFKRNDKIKNNISSALSVRGPVLILIKISSGDNAPTGRVKIKPKKMTIRLQKEMEN